MKLQTYLSNCYISIYGHPCIYISLGRINDIGNYVITRLRHKHMLICITCNGTEIVSVETYVYRESDKSFYLFGMSPCRETLTAKRIDDRTYIDIGTDWWNILSAGEMKKAIEDAACLKKDNNLYTEWFISNCPEHIENYAGPFGCEFASEWNKLHPEYTILPYG